MIMDRNWAILKNSVNADQKRNEIFLSLINKEGTICCANESMIKTFHLPDLQANNINFFDFLHSANHHNLKTAIDYSDANNVPYLMELSLKNEYYHPMKWQVSRLYENNGSGQTYLCIGQKVSEEEKKISEKLKEKEALFDAFMSQTSNLKWVLNSDGLLVFANHAFCRFFELNELEIQDKKFIELLSGGMGDILYQYQQKVLETGTAIESVEKIKLANGNDFVFHINIFPIEGADGKKLVGGQAVNLAAKYEIEKRLREANDRLLLLSRTTTDAIWEWDMQTGQVFRNDALMDMIGYQLEKAKGLSWWLLRIHAEDRSRVADTIKDAIDHGQHSWEEEYKFKCADNTYKHIHDRGYVVYENGLPVKMVGSLQDVSGVKGLENQLMEEKLQRQKEMSETVIRVQEQERTQIGHELHDNVNQILSTVKLFVDMLTPANKEESKIKAKSLEYVMLAIEEIRKLSKELVVPQLQGQGLI